MFPVRYQKAEIKDRWTNTSLQWQIRTTRADARKRLIYTPISVFKGLCCFKYGKQLVAFTIMSHWAIGLNGSLLSLSHVLSASVTIQPAYRSTDIDKESQYGWANPTIFQAQLNPVTVHHFLVICIRPNQARVVINAKSKEASTSIRSCFLPHCWYSLVMSMWMSSTHLSD